MNKVELYNFTAKSSFQYGSMFEDMLRLRYKGFVLEENYDTFSCDGMEFDHYDNPFSQYTIATLNGNVVACTRLGRTDAPYMAQDIWANQIPSKDLPSDANVYELTRLYADSALPLALRYKFQRIVLGCTYLNAVNLDVKKCYFVTYLSVANTCPKLGFDVEIICDINIEGYNNIKYCLVDVKKDRYENVKNIMEGTISEIKNYKL